MVINMIACLDQRGAIGYNNQLLYHIPEDMNRFRILTTGHTILMGRKTYESLPHGALPHRRNIVISHQDLHLKNCEVYHSTEEALAQCQEDVVFVIGGESIYQELIHQTSALYLTVVEEVAPRSDTYFPTIESTKWKMYYHSERKETMEAKDKTICYSFYVYRKVE